MTRHALLLPALEIIGILPAKSETPSQGAAETIRAGTRDEHMAHWRDHSCVVGASRRTWRGIGAGELSQSAGAHRHSLFAGKRGRRVRAHRRPEHGGAVERLD